MQKNILDNNINDFNNYESESEKIIKQTLEKIQEPLERIKQIKDEFESIDTSI